MNSARAREVPRVSEPAVGDHHLLEQVAAGDRNALADLYARYGGTIFRYLLQLTNDRGLAEEVLQDTFVAAWKSARTFEGRSSVQTWLIGVARRQAHNTLRRRTLPRADLAELEVVPADGPAPEEALLAEAERQELVAALRWLSPAQREVLALTFVDGLSYGEIARLVGVPEGTVKSRLSNAKRALRALLQAGEEVNR